MDENHINKFKCDKQLASIVKELRGLFKEEYSNNEELYYRQDYDNMMDLNSEWNCGRYLNHFDMDVSKAFSKLKETLRWRKEMNVYELSETSFPKELWLYSPFFVCGKSKDNCSVIYLLNSHYRIMPEPIQSMSRNFFIYFVDKLDRSHKPGEKIHVVFDESNSSLAQLDISAARWLLSIRDYWPDRIESILVVGLPFVFRPVVRMIISWLPKEWKKILAVGSIEHLVLDKIDIEQLPWFLGGSIGLECKLAPSESKWAKDMGLFKDESLYEALYETICFHAGEEEKQLLEQLQLEHDTRSIN